MRGQPQLLQVVDALSAAGRLASGLNRRQKQRDQNGNDCNDDQQFNQGEASMLRPTADGLEHRSHSSKKERTQEPNR